MKIRTATVGALLLAFLAPAHAQSPAQDAETLVGLPASDVLGSEDIWENPTFVGGVINGGPTASSQY